MKDAASLFRMLADGTRLRLRVQIDDRDQLWGELIEVRQA